MFKSQLQELCHKKKWALPKYSYMRDGPDHNPHFKASVVVDGVNFDSQTIWKSSKQAYNQAAKFAFLHFTSGSRSVTKEEDEPKKENSFQKPKVNPGGSNIQEGETADTQAALLSLTIDAFRAEITNSYKDLLQEFAEKEGLFCPTYTTIKAGNNHELKFISMVEFNGNTFCGNPANTSKQAEINAAMVAHTAIGKDIDSKRNNKTADVTGKKNSDSTLEPEALPEMISLSVSQSRGSNSAAMEMKSYLLCNRVKVYTCIPEIVLPEGTVLLPIAEGKWVAASLEFPDG